MGFGARYKMKSGDLVVVVAAGELRRRATHAPARKVAGTLMKYGDRVAMIIRNDMRSPRKPIEEFL